MCILVAIVLFLYFYQGYLLYFFLFSPVAQFYIRLGFVDHSGLISLPSWTGLFLMFLTYLLIIYLISHCISKLILWVKKRHS